MLKTAGLVAGVGLLALGLVITGSSAQNCCKRPGSAAAAPAGALVCPVMKSTIKDKARSPQLVVNNQVTYFCCGGCPQQFSKAPEKYQQAPLKDVVSGKAFKVTADTPGLERSGALFLFESADTKAAFEQDPDKYSKPRRG
jgi:YHS domain-containing protein